jgi:hypothetical protein
MSYDGNHFYGDYSDDSDDISLADSGYGDGSDGYNRYGYDGRDYYGILDQYSFNDEGSDGEDSDEEEDGDATESDSVLRRNIINRLHASSLQYLRLSGEQWTSFPTMASFRPDLENLISALQSNRSLKEIHICDDILALIGESDQGRLFGILRNLPNLERMFVTGGSPESPTVIHTRVVAEALSQTSNGIKL